MSCFVLVDISDLLSQAHKKLGSSNAFHDPQSLLLCFASPSQVVETVVEESEEIRAQIPGVVEAIFDYAEYRELMFQNEVKVSAEGSGPLMKGTTHYIARTSSSCC